MGGSRIIIDAVLALADATQREIMLFAAVGLALGGLDDLCIDFIYIGRRLWRKLTVYSRHRPMTTATLPRPADARPLAIFVPAWREADVIGAMLRTAAVRWGAGDHRIFVGTYPNDPDTIAQVAAVAAEGKPVTLVINGRPGPTTKADCLNALWRAMQREESRTDTEFKAVVLHDAEDVVHSDELRLLSAMIDRFDLVQLPVLPLASQQSQWIAGHYCDEFAEAHGKSLIVREAVGAAVPSAGVGCAFSRTALEALAGEQHGDPFDPGSLTEDYEIGLRITERGGRSVFVQMRDGKGELVCTREHFPESLEAAVKQKARWMVGISLAGWDRLGWKGGIAEHWMRLRDRRGALAALVLSAAYLGALGYAVLAVTHFLLGGRPPPVPPLLQLLLATNAAIFLWRAIFRLAFVTRAYGWRQGLMSVPRTFAANIIAILAARRAMAAYFRLLRGHPLIWEKTQHRFPEALDSQA